MFYNEPNARWVSVIKSIHADERGVTDFKAIKVKIGPWFHIARLKEDFLHLNINMDTIFKKAVNGELTSFWNDIWIGDSPLKFAFGRLYALKTDKSCSVSSRCPSFDHTSSLTYRRHWRRSPCSGPKSTQLIELEELRAHFRLIYGPTSGHAS
ncbi:RNA-directed DNA polymerase, eukaryota, Reverse transcriptase zinc-binding domain protein [Artemisia annua]|uniref:RNA-directed DNA polymerase, eukaryota, Reverse transcriptase zinc-binding domain protein n=1 Tax=Artemisia annua TaxID=35608 RepID=A0A2U1L5Q8_ARTAN|nr:RNA-directed DNA polymerase, eukaryota, Reverse transcriptase zinc-binding domain protein [Artemisia annua]